MNTAKTAGDLLVQPVSILRRSVDGNVLREEVKGRGNLAKPT